MSGSLGILPERLYAAYTRWLSGKEYTYQCRRRGFDPWAGKIPWRRKWQPTPVSCLENPMDRKAWWATVHEVAKELDMT